jgi:hypothetical protein
MDNKQLIDSGRDQFNRILGFFPRVDAKASVVLAVDTGMLALLASNAPALRQLEGYMIFAAIPVILIGVSLYYLYLGAFPRLEGGVESLIYFREIAKRTENKFIEEFRSQTEENYVKDLLGQVWRNSEILKQKYDHLKTAFALLAWAIIPWAISLAMFVEKNSASQNLIAK